MSFKPLGVACVVVAACLHAITDVRSAAPRFYPDDPITVDDDRQVDVGEVDEVGAHHVDRGQLPGAHARGDHGGGQADEPGAARSSASVHAATVSAVADSSRTEAR
jgi:hypothetical protein